MSDCETYEVEKIVGYRIRDGKEYYKVRWAGFTEEDDTWEPYENLNEACRIMIKDVFGHIPDPPGDLGNDPVSEMGQVTAQKHCYSDFVATDEPASYNKSRTRSSKKSLSKPKKSTILKGSDRNSKMDGKASKTKVGKRKPFAEELQRPVKRCQDCGPFHEELSFSPCLTAESSGGVAKHPDSTLGLTSLSLLDNDALIRDDKEEGFGDHGKALSRSIKKNRKCEKKVVGCTDKIRRHQQQYRQDDSDDDLSATEYPPLPVNKIVGLSVEELDMAIFMSKEAPFTAELKSFQEFRSAALAGNVIAIRNCIQQSKSNSSFCLDSKVDGKTLAIEICETKCDATHCLDDVLQELVRAGARLDATDDLHQRTPLHLAVLYGFWCKVRTLLMLRSPVNLKDRDGKTPLEIALSSRASNFNVKRAIYLLLEHGADVCGIMESGLKSKFMEILLEYDKKVRTLLEIAVSKVMINMTIRTTVTPVMIRGVWEFNNCDCTGELSFNYSIAQLPNEKCFFCVLFAIFHYHGSHARIRLWGESPFAKVSLNSEEVAPLQPESNGFIYPVNLLDGKNKLQVVVLEPCKGVTVLSHSPLKAT